MVVSEDCAVEREFDVLESLSYLSDEVRLPCVVDYTNTLITYLCDALIKQTQLSV